MTFRYLPDVALADIAFEAEADSPGSLFESCALAVTDIMVDLGTLKEATSREFALEAEDPDRLLYNFLTELIFLKDVDSLFVKRFEVGVAADGRSLTATAWGEGIDRERHRLRNDVKAVTMHLFGIRKEGATMRATVVLDI